VRYTNRGTEGASVPDTSHEREPATVTAHNLNHERPRVRRRRRVDVVNRLANTMEGGQCANGEVGHGHVVVNRANKTDDAESLVVVELLRGDVT